MPNNAQEKDSEEATPVRFLSREDLMPVYTTIKCPDAGDIKVLDYVSAGGLAAFAAAKGSDAALRALLEESIEDVVPQNLTQLDLETLCRHFASRSDFGAAFDRESATNPTASAFSLALKSSDMWESHEQMQRDVRQIAERHRNQLASLTQNIFPIDELTRALKPQIKIDLSPRIEFTLGNSIQNAVDESMRRIAEISRPKILANLDVARSLHFTQINERFASISQAAANALRVSDSMLELRQAVLRSTVLETRLLESADADVHLANQQVEETNSLFAKVVDDDATSDETRESEIVLQNDTSLLIVEGSQLAVEIRRGVNSEIDDRIAPYAHLLQRLDYLAKPKSFSNMLVDFGKLVSRDLWQSLWVTPGGEWKRKPESIAQGFLRCYLGGQWHGVAFVGCEIANGDGYIDLLVNYFGSNYLVELKIVGAGWSIGHAECGSDQLQEYMQNYNTSEAYLVVFDGRKTSAGRQLPTTIKTDVGQIGVLSVPVYFEAPSRKGR